MWISAHEKALKVLTECKKDLAEIFELIEKLKSANSEHVLKAIVNLDLKEKAILSNFINRGEIYIKFLEIQKKEPKYIR